MATLATSLPPELLNIHAKYRVIEWIKELGVPSRFRRKLLQDWGAHLGVELSTADYDAVSAPQKPGVEA
jgi:hypothetical protein